ncbi:MAG TPA: hypothetical protein VFW65_35860 [Pseudonocardiaceae bacterium]|nr:hypothetical protein [Pseudonocardiaceae bacterium]
MRIADIGRDYWLTPLATEDMPMIAARLLADGFDSPALRDVAGLGAGDDPRDVRSAFRQALVELGAWLPDLTAAYLSLGRALANAIVSGEAGLDEVAAHIRTVMELDEVIHQPMPDTLFEFLLLCWLHGDECYEDNGGDRRLIAAATELAAQDS